MRLILGVVLLLLGPSHALAQGSIAVGVHKDGRPYTNIVTGDVPSARNEALRLCRAQNLSNCQIIRDFSRRCAAIVAVPRPGGSFMYYGGEALTEDGAWNYAVDACMKEDSLSECGRRYAVCSPVTASWFVGALASYFPTQLFTWAAILSFFGLLIFFVRGVSRQSAATAPAETRNPTSVPRTSSAPRSSTEVHMPSSVPPTSSGPLPPPTEGAALRLSIEITKSETKPFDARGIFYKKIPVHELKVSTAFSEVARVSVQESGLSDMTIISAPFPWSAQGKRLLHEMGQQVPMQNYPLEWFINKTVYIPYDSLVEAHAGANKLEAEFRKVKDAITIAAQPKSRTVEL